MTRPAVVLFVLTLALIGCKGSKDNAATPAATAELTVKAADLLKEYAGNAVAADAKFKGKTVKVTGTFGSAQKAPLMGYAVQVLPEGGSETGGLSNVQCFIDESAQADIAKFKEGQPIALKGICDGQVLGQVKLSKCTVEQ
jgi:hypothetical protein